MGLAELALAAQRTWPVGVGAVDRFDEVYGHDQTLFSPEEYGDHLATSNEIYSVVASRARLMSGLALRFYRGRSSDKTELPASPPAELYWRVNPHWTAERLARMDELSMGVWGQTFWILEGAPGAPREIWWAKASRMRPVPDAQGYLRGWLYQPISGGDEIAFTPDEVVWFRYPNPLDEYSPLPPLNASKLAADTASAMMQANQNLFTNGMQLGGVVVPATSNVAFSAQQADDLERQFERRFRGVDKAHRWMVLRFEAQLKEMHVTQKDAEFLGGLNVTFRQVCRAYGMQAPLAGDLEHATLSNTNAFERLEWSRTLKPDAELRAAEIREQYLPRFRAAGVDWCEYDFTSVPSLQEAATDVWLREAQALDRGAITINEWRASKGMQPVPWGDTPYMPVNKAPLGPDGQLQLPDAPAGAPPDDETNPANQPESPRDWIDHHAARRLLAAIPAPINGWGHS